MTSAAFTDFLLKPELLRAVADAGFEHPSEGIFTMTTRKILTT